MGVGEERKLKGINFSGTLGALERRHGPDARAEVEARLPGVVGDRLRTGSLLASGWYPASWYDALLRTITEQVSTEPHEVRALAREAVRADFQTLFRIVRLFMSPQFALQQSMRVSRRYVDGGTIDVVEARDGLIHYRFSDYGGYTRLMWLDFVGGIEGVLETLGAREPTARFLDGGGDGDDHLEVLIRWRT